MVINIEDGIGNEFDESNDANELEENNEVEEKISDEETLEQAEVEEDKEFEEVEETETEKLKEDNMRLKEKNKKLNEDLTKADNMLKAVQEKHIRLTAEYDNYRKRTAKEKENIYTDSCADVLKEILPVLDNLERAIAVEGNVEELKKGVEMTLKQFNNALEKLNVEEISSEGNFDPNLHNAVMHIESEEHGQNEIVEVFQKGYKRGDKVLRYSMVKVAN